MELKKRTLIFFIICAGLLVVSSFFDYEISLSLYNRTSLLAKGIDIIAELPVFLLMALFGAGIMNTRLKDGSMASATSLLVGFGVMISFGFMCGYLVFWKMNLYSITLVLAIDIAICVCVHILSVLIAQQNADYFRKVSKVGILSFFSMLIICFLALGLIERYPFRSLNGSVIEYEEWFMPHLVTNFSNVEMRSFPSLPCAISSICVIGMVMPMLVSRLKEARLILAIISLSWVFMVSVSQLILGYAYLSDIVWGVLIGFSMLCLFYYLICIRSEKKSEYKEESEA